MKPDPNYRQKSLETLEGESWGELSDAPTHLVKRCIALSKIPINDFSVEDLRILIGQQFGLPFLIPIAIEKLTENLFAEGNFYPGDLLQNVLNVNNSFWESNKSFWLQVNNLIKCKKEELNHSEIDSQQFEKCKFI